MRDLKPAEHLAYVALSLSGWMNNKIGLAWLKEVFQRETKAKACLKPRLLILDSYRSHVSIKFIKYCDQNNILLAILPPHSTYTL